MSQTPPKLFQQTAIESGIEIFSECKRLLDISQNPASSWAAVSQHGKILIEAPTGAGKTLIAGHILETFSAIEDVVWFWFAPFKGLTGQTASALRSELPGLRLRDLATDRQLAGSRTGDVFVTTWQSVATRVRDNRNVNVPGELNLTIDELLAALRAKKLRIGVVVDEAHHGFLGAVGETQAMRFFQSELRPEYALLITATPDDIAIQRFSRALAVEKLNRISISRREPVEEGLIKEGVKCAAYFAPPGQESLVDYEDVALREGVALHKKTKEELKRLKVNLVPLLLVQVSSKDKSVDQARERLIDLGFTDRQIAVHTADEPDSGLLALANDESREVLIFKMAVALGFDAPRASVLVSMRAARDEDFGVQLVGRILRVHRRLQGRARAKTLPEILKNGYVFLADATAQEGLDRAGQRINRLRTEYAKVSPTTAVVRIGEQVYVQVVGEDGQTSLLPVDPPTHPPMNYEDQSSGQVEARTSDEPEDLVLELMTGRFDAPRWFQSDSPIPERVEATAALRTPAGFSYKIRADVPKRFKTQRVSLDNEVTEQDCALKFMVSSAEILRALISKVKVEKRTLEVFTQQIEMDFANAAMDPDQTAKMAVKILTRNGSFDARELRRALIGKLRQTLTELSMDEADDPERVAHMLNVLLVARPELLYNAQKTALASHCEVRATDESLPETIDCETPLPTSRFNVYRVMPPGLNTWEQPFAELLDRDSQKIVRWWHRNLPHKPWSVQVVLDNGKGFFPDFIVGIEGRPNEDGALLTDPKHGFEMTQEQPKTYAEHPVYGRVLILSLLGTAQWMTVRFDKERGRAVLDREFLLSDAAGY